MIFMGFNKNIFAGNRDSASLTEMALTEAGLGQGTGDFMLSSMRTFSFLTALFLWLLHSATSLRAENWPQFRGPTGQGISTEKSLPLKWSSTENVVWKTAIPGEAWSSPIVWSEHVFVTTATDSGESCRVIALDRRRGNILWNKEAFKQMPGHKQQRNTFATPTPATDGERVYACFGDGSFAALDFAGNVVWTNRDYKFYGEHGLGSSPILHNGVLIMARDGSSDSEDKKLGWQKPWDQSYVLALDARSGRERWKGKRGLSRISHGTPVVWDHDGQAELVSEAGDVVQGFDLKTGARLWSSQVIGEGKVPSTVVGGGFVFTAGGWGGKETTKAFRLGGVGDLKESNLVWEQKKGMPRVPSMIYVNSHLFAITDGGVASCMKGDTGELIWQERIGGNFSASPVAAEGRIYFVGDSGETTVIEAAAAFKVLAKNPLGEKVQASPAISQGQIFIRTDKRLYCIANNSHATTLSPRGTARAVEF
jgi:outer membrane protein assembly factor BamB